MDPYQTALTLFVLRIFQQMAKQMKFVVIGPFQ